MRKGDDEFNLSCFRLSRVVLEIGTPSPWGSRLEFEMILAHARNVRLIGESRKKDHRPMRRHQRDH